MKWYTLWLAVVCVVVFLLQLIFPGITEDFLLRSSDVIARPWILITSVFLHGSISHLVFNMFALIVFGLLLEGEIGSRRFLIIFFLTGIVASIVSSIFYNASLGASGAIFGVIGTLAILRPMMTVWAFGVPMPMIIAATAWGFIDILSIPADTGIANLAHIAGLFSGIFIGFLIRPKHITKEKREKILAKKDIEKWEDEWMRKNKVKSFKI